MLLKYGKLFHSFHPYFLGKRIALIHTQQFWNSLKTSNASVSNNFFYLKRLYSKAQPLEKDATIVYNSNVMDHAARRKFLKIFFYFIGTLGFATGVFYYPKNINDEFPFVQPKLQLSTGSELLAYLEERAERITEYCTDLLEKIFPHPATPLLPDAADLNYPPNFPTLVVDLNYVVSKLEYNHQYGWRVIKRPGADQFFKELIYHYEIILWSDDNFPVAQDVCSQWQLPVAGVLHRDQCLRKNGKYIKDLSRLGRPLERTLILDHDPSAFLLQPDNGILISPFNGEENNVDLKNCIGFLKMAALSPHKDIRDVIKEYGGGDQNLIKRWMATQSSQKKKTKACRNLGQKIFGNHSISKP